MSHLQPNGYHWLHFYCTAPLHKLKHSKSRDYRFVICHLSFVIRHSSFVI
ncbi:hypothetical protein [Coleofasciculus sp. F4-SAH-05]